MYFLSPCREWEREEGGGKEKEGGMPKLKAHAERLFFFPPEPGRCLLEVSIGNMEM